MTHYLFLWNGNRAFWPSQDDDIATLRKHGTVRLRWSLRSYVNLRNDLELHGEVGALLFRTGRRRTSHGIVGVGIVRTPPFQGENYDPARAGKPWYAEIDFTLLSPEPLIDRTRLEQLAPEAFGRLRMGSGYRLGGDPGLEQLPALLNGLR